MCNSFVSADIREIVKSKLPFQNLENKSITVFGATGQIGTAFIHTLAELNNYYALNITCNLVGRNLKKLESLWMEYPWVKIFIDESADVRSDYIVHLACPTSSRKFVKEPYTTIDNILEINKKVIDYALFSQASILYVSSMEVYGKTDCEFVNEETRGVLDWTSSRSSYSEGKRLSELLFLTLAEEHGLDTRIVRPTLTFGSAVQPEDNRVYAQFVRSILAKKDIVLHTTGESKRDYLYVYDLIRAIFIVMLLGKSGEAYNISNPESYCSIREMAELARTFSPEIKVVYDIQKDNGYAPEVKIRLDNSKIDSLYSFPRVSLKEMFRTALSLTREVANAK